MYHVTILGAGIIGSAIAKLLHYTGLQLLPPFALCWICISMEKSSKVVFSNKSRLAEMPFWPIPLVVTILRKIEV
ncbi:MAG: hypothetical protein MGG11_16220 [Trichodesmium sp. MAG_R03]|nr:hypothetical protein [Trichodesmium sp. MAG_R03]